MADKANIGPKIVLEGEKEYRQAITGVNKSMSVLKSELHAVAAEFDGNANSIDALRAKNEVLTKQHDEQKRKLQLLRGALENANATYGEGSTQVQNWQIKLNNAYADLNKLNKELTENQKHLSEAEKSTDKTAKSIDEFGKEVKDAEKKTSTFGDVLKANLAGTAIIEGIKAISSSITEVVDSTAEFRNDFSKLKVNADTAGASIDAVSQQLKNLDAITGETDSNIEALSNLLQAGITGDSLTKTVEALSGAVIKFPDTLKIESLSDALQETLATGKATGQFGELLERLGYNLDTFNNGMALSATYADKQSYALNLLANTGLASVNAEYVKNNQTMIEYSNAQFELRERMSEIAVAVTPLLSKAMAVLAENMGDITEDILPVVINGFTWMVENVDTIEAGLKGIGAAFITKKAADGVLAAVNAYKALTTATQAATVAQTAFNTASKANIIVAIASVVIGAGTALASYAKSASDAADETKKLNDENQKLIDKNKEVYESIQGNIKDRQKSIEKIQDEAKSTKTLIDSLYNLAEEENKSNSSKEQMISLVNQINNVMPGLNLAVSEQTGLLNLQRQEVDKLVESRIELSTAEALQGQLSTIALDKYNQEQALNDALDAQTKKREELNNLVEKRNNYSGYGVGITKLLGLDKAKLDEMNSEIKKLTEELDANELSIEAARGEIDKLGRSYKDALDYIGDHTALDNTTKALDSFLGKYQEVLNEQNEDFAGSLDDRVDMVEDSFKASEKALDKHYKAEQKALDKAQKEQLDKVQEFADKEFTILENKHKEKLKLINQEYLEKIKLVDEDRYNELKDVQDQIDAIDAQADAEDRARKTIEQAEKRAELNMQIASAKTAEEKLEAQQELADFEEEVAADRLKTERALQKDILEEQKDTINSSYDAKVKSLKEEQTKEEEKADAIYEKEKIVIENRLEAKKQELEDIHELEDTALSDKQEAEQTALDDTKAYAIKSVKETYEEDLKQFKLNNALKYNEAVANQDAINKYIKESAVASSPGLGHTLPSLYTNPYEYKYSAFSSNSNVASQAIEIDYDKITTSMVKAIKSSGLQVVLNNKVVGSIMDKQINNYLR
jgi:hypothetical protein